MGRLDASVVEASPLTRDEAMAVLEDHNRRTTHFGEVLDADVHAQGYNPSCGDRYDVFLDLSGSRVERVRFHGFGCVISRASASIMSLALEGCTDDEALGRIGQLRAAVMEGDDLKDLPFDAHALMGVREHPSRIKCVLLPWQAAKAALTGERHASTE